MLRYYLHLVEIEGFFWAGISRFKREGENWVICVFLCIYFVIIASYAFKMLVLEIPYFAIFFYLL